MRTARLAMIVALAAAFSASACTRPAQEEVREETAEVDQQLDQLQARQRDEKTRLEQRAAELERKYEALEAKTAQRTNAATTRAKAEIKEELAEVRREINELDTTNAENWWERQEREWERTAADIEADVQRFARRWTPEVKEEVTGTVGDADTWEARRDRFVNRMQARIESMEQALRDVGPDADKEDVEDTRARIRDLRDENERLRTASEDDWWDVTRDRVNRFIDRLDARIDRLVNDNS